VNPTYKVEAGHYRLFALPDDLSFDPAQIDVGETAAEPLDVRVALRR
jgi:hypothetical protein